MAKSKSEMDLITEQTISRRGVLAKLYFDMHAEEKEKLQPLLADLVNERLLKSNGVIYCYGSIEEPMQTNPTNYSTSAMVTILFKDLDSLVNVVFNFAPVGVDILKPEGEYRMTMQELQAMLISISQISVNYSEYILNRVLSKEDLEKVMQDMKNREEIGKRLLERKRKEAASPPAP